MSDVNNPAFTQNFTVEILTSSTEAAPSFIAQALAKAITGWEREFNEDDENIEDGFLVQGVNDETTDDMGDDADDSDEDGDDEEGDDTDEELADDEDEQEAIVEEPSDSILNLVTTVNAAVLNDIKAIQALDVDERVIVRIIYGDDEAKLIRQFVIAPDLGVVLPGGDKITDLLKITLVADIYDAETIF